MKTIKFFVISIISVALISLNLLPISALNSEIVFTDSNIGYNAIITDVDVNEKGEFTSNIVEYDEKFLFGVNYESNYACMDDVYYSIDDMEKAIYNQAKSMSDGYDVTIKECLSEFTPITDISEYKKLNNTFNNNVEDLDFVKISTRGFGDYYSTGKWKKANFTVAITTAAATALGGWAYAVYKGAFIFAKATLVSAAKSFCSSFLTGIGGDYLATDAWYRREQAILNIHNTTSVRASFGADGKNSTVWGPWHYKTFETQKPYSV